MLPKPVERLPEKQLAAAPSASARGVEIDSLKSFIVFDFREMVFGDAPRARVRAR